MTYEKTTFGELIPGDVFVESIWSTPHEGKPIDSAPRLVKIDVKGEMGWFFSFKETPSSNADLIYGIEGKAGWIVAPGQRPCNALEISTGTMIHVDPEREVFLVEKSVRSHREAAP